MPIHWYRHHGELVAVEKGSRGRHREHCLCYKCTKFHPLDRARNCPRASALYLFDKEYHMVTPVWECPEFDPKNIQ